MDVPYGRTCQTPRHTQPRELPAPFPTRTHPGRVPAPRTRRPPRRHQARRPARRPRSTPKTGADRSSARAGQGRAHTLNDQLAERDTSLAKLERQLAKASTDAHTAQTDRQTAARRESQARQQAEERADACAQALNEERDARDELEVELDDLRERAVDELYCHRCAKWVSPADWVSGESDAAHLLYHRQCGFHRGTPLTQTSILAIRRN